MTFSPREINSALKVFDRLHMKNAGARHILSVQIDTTRAGNRLFRCCMAQGSKGNRDIRQCSPFYYIGPQQIVNVIVGCALRSLNEEAGSFVCYMTASDFEFDEDLDEAFSPCDLDFIVTPEINKADLFLEVFNKVSDFISGLKFVGFRGKTLDELNAEEEQEVTKEVDKEMQSIHQKVSMFGASTGVHVPTMKEMRENGDGFSFLIPQKERH